MLAESNLLRGYAYPSRSADACKLSLIKSTANFKVIPEPEGLRVAAEKAADRGAKASIPEWFQRFRIPKYYDVACAIFQLNEDANAGYPYCLDGMKKQPFARMNKDDVVAHVQLRIAALMLTPLSEIEAMTAVQLVQAGLVDPTAVIEKNEPTKVEKLREGRARNVICGSVIDELIDRLVFGDLNKAQIRHWGDVPSCIGLGFTEEKIAEIHLAMVYLFLEGSAQPLRSSDVKGFEFSIQRWGFRGDWIRRCRALGVPEDHPFAQLMWKRMICIMRSVYVFTDGTMYAQIVDGWQKSGEINTSSTNTAVREIDAYLVGAEAARAAGDDCIETEVENAVEKYAAIGVTIKTYDLASPDRFEFCSHLFRRDGPPIPLNAPKSFFKLCCEEPDEQKIRQVISQFQHAPELREFLRLFTRHYRPVG